MEKRLKDYKKFINSRIDNPDDKLITYHREMLRNFQHERMVHLIIMLFFVSLTLGLTVFYVAMMNSGIYYFFEFLPMLIATVLMWVLSVCYVKHYYFLENHVQALYDVSQKLYENGSKRDSIDFKAVGKKIAKKVEKH